MTRNARTKQFRKEIQEQYCLYLKEYFIYPIKEKPYIWCKIKKKPYYDAGYYCLENNKDNKYYLFRFNKIRKMFKAYENPESEILLKKKRHSWKNILKLYNTKLNKQLKISKMKAKRY